MKYDPLIKITENEEVYPPSDDSIMLIRSFDVKDDESVLELGCGSGIVSIHCARDGAKVTCGDINPKAVELTKLNASNNGVVLDVRETDIYSDIDGMYDTIIFNLPYLPVQDKGELAKAWSGGEDGMGPLPELLEYAPAYLNSDGRVIIVVSSLMNERKLSNLLSNYEVKELSELPLFFEKLKVLEITFNR